MNVAMVHHRSSSLITTCDHKGTRAVASIVQIQRWLWIRAATSQMRRNRSFVGRRKSAGSPITPFAGATVIVLIKQPVVAVSITV
jgi:hypothetical protein